MCCVMEDLSLKQGGTYMIGDCGGMGAEVQKYEENKILSSHCILLYYCFSRDSNPSATKLLEWKKKCAFGGTR